MHSLTDLADLLMLCMVEDHLKLQGIGELNLLSHNWATCSLTKYSSPEE